MPKDRKMTYSDHQAQAARQKKQAPKKNGQLSQARPGAAPSDKNDQQKNS